MITLPAYWLVLTMCLSQVHCVERLYPKPFPGFQICRQIATAMVVDPRTPYLPPWRCVLERPSIPVVSTAPDNERGA